MNRDVGDGVPSLSRSVTPKPNEAYRSPRLAYCLPLQHVSWITVGATGESWRESRCSIRTLKSTTYCRGLQA